MVALPFTPGITTGTGHGSRACSAAVVIAKKGRAEKRNFTVLTERGTPDRARPNRAARDTVLLMPTHRQAELAQFAQPIIEPCRLHWSENPD